MFSHELLGEIRDKFHYVESCPYQGKRIFFENAGGSLTLKSVVETNTRLSAIPDNQGRDNLASAAMVNLIQTGKQDMMTFLGAEQGLVFVGESGTECLFRVIRSVLLNTAQGGRVLGSTLEHPATASAAQQWSARLGKKYIAISHNSQYGTVTAAEYRRHITADTRLATIIQTSPVTGISVDVQAIAAVIRAAAPECFIVVDGIQHAPHGDVHVKRYGIDAYAVSGYKVFSRHNYGFVWVSPRLKELPHEHLEGNRNVSWELGTRDAAAYATFSEVVKYLEWLGAKSSSEQPSANARRAHLTAAGKAIARHEKHLVEVMLHGNGQLNGLSDMREVLVIGGCDNAHRKGLVSLVVHNMPSADLVRELGKLGIRVHIRNNDYFSGKILTPLNLETCVRVSMCHYNTVDEVEYFLKSIVTIIAGK